MANGMRNPLGNVPESTGLKIARALQGFGAGVAGKGLEFSRDLDNRRKSAMLQDAYSVQQMLEAGDESGARTMLQDRLTKIDELGGDPKDTLMALNKLEQGDVASLHNDVTTLVNFGQAQGLINLHGSGMTAAEREFEAMTKDFTPEEKARALRIRAGLEAREGTLSSVERQAGDVDLAERVTKVESTRAGAKEKAKFEQQYRYKPRIEQAVTKAKKDAESRNEKLSDLQQAEVALPVLEDVVANLRELTETATFTRGGKALDFLSKELGFGATKGATARARYTAIIDNEILPLLKQTFGAAFTAPEGERLRATLGDPDASPREKNAQLDAFIESKYRGLSQKRSAAGVNGSESIGTPVQDFSGFKIRSIK